MKEVQAAIRLREKLGVEGKEAEEISRKAKRMFSMTLTDGAISSLLFAYSKAKNENVKKLVEGDYEKYREMSKEEEREWALIVAFLVKEALSNISADGDLVNLLKKLSDGKVRVKAERAMLRYLKALGKVLEAYS
ncbi:MAG: type III-B CRISPR module-associated protein Cmr5 [Candidatus Jordarchaeales archaeon]